MDKNRASFFRLGYSEQGEEREADGFPHYCSRQSQGHFHEPLVKTLQKAKTVKDKASGIFRADFKLDAFAQPMLEITAADNAEITVLIGEKLTADGKSVGRCVGRALYRLPFTSLFQQRAQTSLQNAKAVLLRHGIMRFSLPVADKGYVDERSGKRTFL